MWRQQAMNRWLTTTLWLLAMSPVAAAPIPSAEEQSAWIAVSASDDKSAYTEFIGKYPNGTFAPLARIRLDEVGSSTPGVTPARLIVDPVPLDRRYPQKRSIEPRAKSGCFDSPDAGCVLSEVTVLIGRERETSTRLDYLCSLAQKMAELGDVAGAVRFLQQAASLARGLSAQDKADNLSKTGARAAAVGNMQLANELLNEALATARTIGGGKSDYPVIRDRGAAIAGVAARFATIGNADRARSIFVEAQEVSAKLAPAFRSYLTKTIAEKQIESGLVQNALLTISDYLGMTNEMPQWNAIGTLEIMGRYSNMGNAAELLASAGQDSAAITLAHSVGPTTLRVGKLLRVHDKLAGNGARDLIDLEHEIRDTAREAAKAKDAWIFAGDLGCALARFGSAGEGISLARNLYARSMGNPPYFSQRMFVECLAENVEAEKAADYLMSTRLPSDPKAASDYNGAVEEIAKAYVRQGDRTTARQWIAKLPEAEQASASSQIEDSAEDPRSAHIAELARGGRFKEAIAEALKLKSQPDGELAVILDQAIKVKDVDSAMTAARSIKDDSSRISAFSALLEVL
jgi:hypothetical protein